MKAKTATVIGVITLVVVFALLLAGTQTRQERLRIDWEIAPEPPFVVGIIPYIAGPELSRELNPLVGFLQKNMKRPVKLLVASDYEMLGRLVDYGKVHFAWFSTASYENLNTAGRWEVLCRPVRNNTVRHRGIILARADGGLHTLADLRGKTFGYVDRNSGTGYVYANRLLVEQGFDPLNFFGAIDFSGNHSRSIDRLREGTYDAIATLDIFATPGLIKDGELASFTMLGATQWILNDPMIVRKDLEAPVKKQLRELFARMETFPDGPETLKHLQEVRKWDRFADEEEIQRGGLRVLGQGEDGAP